MRVCKSPSFRKGINLSPWWTNLHSVFELSNTVSKSYKSEFCGVNKKPWNIDGTKRWAWVDRAGSWGNTTRSSGRSWFKGSTNSSHFIFCSCRIWICWKKRIFTEKDWTRLNSEVPVLAYQKSKTLAEKEAWDFIAKQGKGLELAVILPVGILGPVLSPEASTSTESIRKLLEGMPGVPNISFGVVDVRDVADLHIRALLSPAANGERFLAVAGEPLSVKEMADILKSHLGDAAKKVPSRVLPDWVVKFAALLDPTLRSAVPGLGKHPVASNQKAKDILKWAPVSNEEAVLATAESLVAFGLIKRWIVFRCCRSYASGLI